MKLKTISIVLLLFVIGGLAFYLFFYQKQKVKTYNLLPSLTPVKTTQIFISPTPYPDTKNAIEAFLANKYQKSVSDVHVTLQKEEPGFASGSVSFGQGGPGEGGMWLAVLGNGWKVVWDGNGNVDCNKMRREYGFPDTILKPNFCN